jgi:hypothetical protein
MGSLSTQTEMGAWLSVTGKGSGDTLGKVGRQPVLDGGPPPGIGGGGGISGSGITSVRRSSASSLERMVSGPGPGGSAALGRS